MSKESKKENFFFRILKKISEFNMSKVFHKFYYYVPPCPKCNSKITGRFMKELPSAYDNDWRMRECLSNGEIIAAKKTLKGNENCFCVKCGHTYPAIVSLKFMSKYKIEQEKEDRKTDIILYNYEKKNEDREIEKPDLFRRFIGHM